MTLRPLAWKASLSSRANQPIAARTKSSGESIDFFNDASDWSLFSARLCQTWPAVSPIIALESVRFVSFTAGVFLLVAFLPAGGDSVLTDFLGVETRPPALFFVVAVLFLATLVGSRSHHTGDFRKANVRHPRGRSKARPRRG
ncbi:MAG: hypothetical protein AAF961_05650 [Planctomycetota bacterium]